MPRLGRSLALPHINISILPPAEEVRRDALPTLTYLPATVTHLKKCVSDQLTKRDLQIVGITTLIPLREKQLVFHEARGNLSRGETSASPGVFLRAIFNQ
jgi:hypothetical protein